MEAKLNEAISAQDWYSAHQLLLSLAQRHQRARRFSQSKKLLASGLKDMCPVGNEKAWPPLATTIDIAEKYVEVYEATPVDESLEIEESCVVFSVILAACDADKEADEKHTGVWADVSGKLAAKNPSLVDPFYDILLSSTVPLDWKTSWAVEHLSGQKEAWSSMAESITRNNLPCDALVCTTVMHLLAQKAFGSASTFLKTILSQLKEQKNGQITFTPIDDATGNLPSFLCFLDSSTEQVSLLNAAQLFFLLAQRKSPAKSHFNALRERFKLNEELSQLSDLLSRVYSPQPKRAQEPMNPLASMFQNMFSGGGGMPPMPQSGPAPKKAALKKPALDLD